MIGQIREMARRSILQTLRQPAMVIPPVVFPLLLVSINAAGLSAATRIPGFPADSYWDFAIAVPFIQGSLFAAINAGTAMADADGNLWVAERSLAFAKSVTYARISPRGGLLDRVLVPNGSTIVGFGPGVVYVSSHPTGLNVTLSRHPIDAAAGSR